jgi:hypothetical protein
MMTGNELIAEGQRLSRPCVHLRPDGEKTALAASWRGPGQVPPPAGDYEHWITIDCGFLPAGAALPTGVVSIYTDGSDRYGAVAYDPALSFSLARGGRPLYAHPTSSLPPLEAVFLYGSPAVREWLARIEWQPDWGWNGNFPDAEVADAYIESQRVNLPLDGESVFAVLGGWHVPWPDGDWLELVNRPLVVLTLAEAEPWVEAFNMGGRFQVIQRVS